jgi:hypothetical protein
LCGKFRSCVENTTHSHADSSSSTSKESTSSTYVFLSMSLSPYSDLRYLIHINARFTSRHFPQALQLLSARPAPAHQLQLLPTLCRPTALYLPHQNHARAWLPLSAYQAARHNAVWSFLSRPANQRKCQGTQWRCNQLR